MIHIYSKKYILMSVMNAVKKNSYKTPTIVHNYTIKNKLTNSFKIQIQNSKEN